MLNIDSYIQRKRITEKCKIGYDLEYQILNKIKTFYDFYNTIRI